jgi:NitT/TauT family transport system substrate-binding protein
MTSRAAVLLILAIAILPGCGPGRTPPLRLVTFQGAVEPYVAETIGAWREEGLAVNIEAVPGTARAMEALMAGSADLILGTYEQVIQMQSRGRAIHPVYVLDTCHCLALVTLRPEIKTIRDLNGRTIGVAAPGGQMQSFARYLMRQSGGEAAYPSIGVGPAAVAALEAGRVDAAIVLYTSYETLRQRHPELRVLAETFTRVGMRQALGVDAYPSKSLLAAQPDPDRDRRLRAALSKTIRWMKSHTPEEILDRVPEPNRGADRGVDLLLLRQLTPLASETGEVPEGGDAIVRRILGSN